MVGWLITEKFAETNDGQPMEFTTFEDLIGLYEATFFPKVFQQYAHLLTGNRPHLLEGILEEEFGEVTLTAHQLALITPKQQPSTTTHPSSVR